MSSTPDAVDARLVEAHDLAIAALKEITPEATIGAPAGHRVEDDGVVSLLFATRLEGYPGWFWTVSVAAVDDAEPTVLEVELLPGDGALLAPEWVPWAVRLAEYRAQQVALAEARAAEGVDDEPDPSADGAFDELDDDADDLDDDDDDLEHDDDVDGVDIDDLADASASDDDLDPDDDDETDDYAVAAAHDDDLDPDERQA